MRGDVILGQADTPIGILNVAEFSSHAFVLADACTPGTRPEAQKYGSRKNG